MSVRRTAPFRWIFPRNTPKWIKTIKLSKYPGKYQPPPSTRRPTPIKIRLLRPETIPTRVPPPHFFPSHKGLILFIKRDRVHRSGLILPGRKESRLSFANPLFIFFLGPWIIFLPHFQLNRIWSDAETSIDNLIVVEFRSNFQGN